MARGQGVAHVGLHDKLVVCFHCGARDVVIHDDQRHGIAINSPAWAGFVAHGIAFEKAHAKCKETPESPSIRLEATPEEWERGLFVGSSSGTIFTVCMGRRPMGFAADRLGAAPLDPADFNRCHRLLRVQPEWRSRLGEVALAYPTWKGLVEHWDELTAMLEAKNPAMYDRMQVLLERGR